MPFQTLRQSAEALALPVAIASHSINGNGCYNAPSTLPGSLDAAGRWCGACTCAANLAERVLNLDSMQKRRKKVPDVIRRGIRLFIGLAVCNGLGFYLSQG